MRRLLVATLAAAVLSTAPSALAQAPPVPSAPADTSKKDKNDELPLTTTRSVEFETSEGTWMSLDVSPDGKRIVFLSDRSGAENIWLCDGDGKNAKALTKGTNNLYASADTSGSAATASWTAWGIIGNCGRWPLGA